MDTNILNITRFWLGGSKNYPSQEKNGKNGKNRQARGLPGLFTKENLVFDVS